jgi:cobalamin synthase
VRSDWTENWIRGILAFHVILLLTVLLLRNNANAQCVILLCIFALTRAAESINTYAAAHWTEFATQNYFDKNGVFMGTVFAAPLLCIAFLQLVSGLPLVYVVAHVYICVCMLLSSRV